jgi:hypothetical protein
MDINQSINDFNQKKVNAEKKFIYAFIVLGIAIIIGLIVFSQANNENLMAIPIIVGIPGLILLGIGAYDFSKVKKAFKKDFLTAVFNELIPGINYRPEQGLSKDIVYGTEFLKRADRFHSEDYLQGKIDDIDFVSSDVKLEEKHVRHTKNGTQTYYVAYFVGRIFRFDFNKELVGNLQVLESGRPVSRRRFKKVDLESIDFNKKFNVFTEEELTAFYILTPDIMEAIFALEKRHPGNIKFSFSNQQMYLGINNNKNTFELRLFKKLSEQTIQEFKDDLLVVKDVIHTLKLNNNLFKKREDL